MKKEQGNTLLKSGQYEEAYAVYTEALTVDPDNVDLNSKLYCNRALAGSKVYSQIAALTWLHSHR